jgi:hypothetical protein
MHTGTFSSAQVVDLIRALDEVEQDSERTRWNTPDDRLYSRAYRVACALSTRESWKDQQPSPIGIFLLLANLNAACNAAIEACEEPAKPEVEAAAETPAELPTETEGGDDAGT